MSKLVRYEREPNTPLAPTCRTHKGSFTDIAKQRSLADQATGQRMAEFQVEGEFRVKAATPQAPGEERQDGEGDEEPENPHARMMAFDLTAASSGARNGTWINP